MVLLILITILHLCCMNICIYSDQQCHILRCSGQCWKINVDNLSSYFVVIKSEFENWFSEGSFQDDICYYWHFSPSWFCTTVNEYKKQQAALLYCRAIPQCVLRIFCGFFFPEVLQSWRVQFDSPISTVLLFPLSCQTEPHQPSGETSMLLVCCSFIVLFLNLQHTSRLLLFFFRCGNERLQPSGNQHHWDGSCLQVRTRQPCKGFRGITTVQFNVYKTP